MKILFFGTPEFAAHCLSALIEAKHNIVGVVTAPDKKAGRGQKVGESAVKTIALKNGLPLLQPTNLKSDLLLEELKLLQPDIAIVVAFRMLPESIWALPPMGCFNLHASLLPQYRGAAPIQWAIINGEKKTGLTTFFLNHTIDTGDIILQKEVAIPPHMNAGELHDLLKTNGAELILKTLNLIAEDKIATIPQKNRIDPTQGLKNAPKLYPKNFLINWNTDAESIHNKIRGLSPYPGAFGWLNINSEVKKLKIFKATICQDDLNLKAGDIKTNGKQVFVGCKDQTIELEQVQLEGKKKMSMSELLNGIQNFPKKFQTDHQ